MQWKLNWIALTLLVTTGCATSLKSPPASSAAAISQRAADHAVQTIQIERGRPNRFVDSVGDVLGLPDRIALWDRRVNNHKISSDTEEQLIQYMAANGLESTLIRANQYHPLGEWKRLTQNKQVAAGWRYTIGTYNVLKYTFLPGRLTGGDWYNPYTDTINLSSDVPGLALFAAAYAKDAKSRENIGLYTAIQELPIIGLQHETIATNEILDYANRQLSPHQVAQYRKTLLPNYGATVGSQLASFFPYGNVIGRLAGAAFGHVGNEVITNEKTNPEPPAGLPAQDPIIAVVSLIEETP